MDTNDKIILILVIYLYLRYLAPKATTRKNKRKREDTSTTSRRHHPLEILEGNNTECIESLRMSRDAFVRLCTHFRIKGYLKDSKHVPVEEKMVIFLMMIGHNQRFAEVQRVFKYSTQTIHKYFHEVLDKMLKFASEMVVPTNFDLNPDNPTNNTKLRKVFKGAVGVLDGILIHAIAPNEIQHLYKRRGNDECYQNVLAVCDFNMVFTYIVAGWEGIAHDNRILWETVADPNMGFPLPPSDKYYLCDVAYADTRGFMTPYRSSRYKLGDFHDKPPINNEEKFNHAHTKLRNVIDRAFCVLKARSPILKKMAPYDLVIQRNITVACFAIHNFIRKEGLSDEFFSQYDQTETLPSDDDVQGNDEYGKYDEEEGHEDDDDDGEDDDDCEDEEEVQPIDDNQQYMIDLREEIAGQLVQNVD